MNGSTSESQRQRLVSGSMGGMDPGLAAVIAGGIGVVGGVGATLVGGLLSRGAARDQLRAQARSQRTQWLAELRLDAHVAYMAKWDEALTEIGRLWEIMADTEDPYSEHASDPQDVANDLSEKATEAVTAVRPAYERVLTLGPDDLAEVATRAWEALGGLCATSRARFQHNMGDSWWRDLETAQDQTRAVLGEYREATGKQLTTAPDPTE